MNISTNQSVETRLLQLKNSFSGEIYTDKTTRLLYSTDASAYREYPLAVVVPKNSIDLKKIIAFADANSCSVIPRGAGTSLAGQVVGKGIVVDISRFMNKILEVNQQESWIRVEPGVVLEEMNILLAEKGLFFGPETSTANRCSIAGMVGNNACGLHSLEYGSTRDHLLSVKTILSDGSEVEFGALSKAEYDKKCELNSLEGEIYKNLNKLLSNKDNANEIIDNFPNSTIPRRNTGYAIDLLLDSNAFGNSDKKINLSNIIAGSEGTLAFITEIKLNLVPLPSPHKALVCAHFPKLEDSFEANLVALAHHPTAVELMDKTILDLTKGNIEQRKNRFFIDGDPDAVLMIEFVESSEKELEKKVKAVIKDLKKSNLGYSFPIIKNADITKVWNLRKAGLGVLSNLPGDAKPVSVIEDSSVKPEDMSNYIADLQLLFDKYHVKCVYHAHIATGELHLRPILNLKDKKDVEIFHDLAEDAARVVKKYNGSLSGEHGDGRLRGEFIPIMIGEKNYEFLKQIKASWDPKSVFNPGKIVDTPKMNTSLRFEPGEKIKEIETIFDFSKTGGYIRATEKCNGSGDCRKTEAIGGTMCPSYMATRDEHNTPRARANILREFVSNSTKENPFDHKEVYDILDTCVSCKGCKSECPSSVDITKLKAEFMQHYYDKHGIPLRTRAIAYISDINRLGSIIPSVTNFFMSNVLTSQLAKKMLGFAPKRSIPLLYKITLRAWANTNLRKLNPKNSIKKVYLFADEFTQFNDTEIGIKAIKLLTSMGYEVELPKHTVSGRTFLSKGLVRSAKKIVNKNIDYLKDIISQETPLLGIEPSGILAFRDEYPDLAEDRNKEAAEYLAKTSLLIEEFFVNEVEKGNISADMFTTELQHMKLHGHCQQKAVASTEPTKKMLSLPKNYSVEEIPSGCCGMA
ncbi:MAG: FAD-binding and (Fe-S)-binding domain-containing protein, partial [Bacteroidota bacterium]|nr:FAD-binding and (Fe-S)-binding domain-containing protein [Bacteroidota bacterium]